MRTPSIATAILVLTTVACAKPSENSLRDSFAQQVARNRFISAFQRSGNDLTFTGPGAEGGVAKWRVHIDSAVIEANDDPKQPYKGIVKSSWYSDNQLVTPSGRDSNLPIELMANGLSQDCWAFWDETGSRWSWE